MQEIALEGQQHLGINAQLHKMRPARNLGAANHTKETIEVRGGVAYKRLDRHQGTLMLATIVGFL